MRLSELKEVVLTKKVLLVQANDLLEQFISDTSKEILGVSKEQYFTVRNKSDLKQVYSLGSVQPFGAIKWLIIIEADKIPITELITHFKHGDSCFYICLFDKYFAYKKLKTELDKYNKGNKKKNESSIVFDELYLNYLKRYDFDFLYSKYVGKRDNGLTESLLQYVYRNYAGDVDAIFSLFDAIRNDEIVEKERDIVRICGLGRNTTQNFLIKILTSKPKTEKGLKTAMRTNFQRGMDLSNDLKWEQIWTFSRAFIKNAIVIKTLCISGVVYKDLRNVPDTYDVKTLAKYSRYIWFIREQTLSKLLAVYTMLDKLCWQSELEFYAFLCDYFKYSILTERS